MKRLLNDPSYTILKTPDNKYRTSIMMVMDCETHPFDTVTKLSNLNDLYINYYTESNNLSYNIAKNLLSTNKVNIFGINPITNDDIRSTLCIYERDDKLKNIYPTYSTIKSYLDTLEDSKNKYIIELPKEFKKNFYFKIYKSYRENFLISIFFDKILNAYDKTIYSNDKDLLISNKFGIDKTKYKNNFSILIDNSTTIFDLKQSIIDILNENEIDYEFTNDNKIIIYTEYINERILTNCNFETGTEIKQLMKVDTTLLDTTSKWYAYDLKLLNINENFYFKYYYTKQSSILFCSINKDTLTNYQRGLLDSKLVKNQNLLIKQLFNINDEYFTKSYIFLHSSNISEDDFKYLLLKNLHKQGLFINYNVYNDDFGENTRYITIFSNIYSEPILTNLESEINYSKSYDIDYIANIDYMLFSVWSLNSIYYDNIRLTINRFNDIYQIQINLLNDLNTVYIETFSDENLKDLEFKINSYSKLININIKSDYLPTGTFALTRNNIDKNIYDNNIIDSFSKINEDFIYDNRIDILYNTYNNMNLFNIMNNLKEKCNGRLLLISDNIIKEQEVNRYDFSNIINIETDENNKIIADKLHVMFNYIEDNISYYVSEQLLENIVNNTLKDDKKYKKFWFVSKDNLFIFNKCKYPEELSILNKFEIFDTEQKKFSVILKEFENNYFNDKKKKSIDYINNCLKKYNLDSKYSIDNELTENNDYIVIKDLDTSRLEYHIINNENFYDLLGNDFSSIERNSSERVKFNFITDKILIDKIKINKNVNVEFDNNKLDFTILNKRIKTRENFDSSYILLSHILNNNEYEYDISEIIDDFDTDNDEEFDKYLEEIYKSTILNNCVRLNRLYDNEYYYSMFNPVGSYKKYLVTINEMLSATLQINRLHDLLQINQVNINKSVDILNLINEVNSEVNEIINTGVKLELKNFTKNNRSISLVLQVTFENSTKLTYDFNINISITNN